MVDADDTRGRESREWCWDHDALSVQRQILEYFIPAMKTWKHRRMMNSFSILFFS